MNNTNLEQEAQKGPHVFLPPWQQAGYPPKHSPMLDTNIIHCMATSRAITENIMGSIINLHVKQDMKASFQSDISKIAEL